MADIAIAGAHLGIFLPPEIKFQDIIRLEEGGGILCRGQHVFFPQICPYNLF